MYLLVIIVVAEVLQWHFYCIGNNVSKSIYFYTLINFSYVFIVNILVVIIIIMTEIKVLEWHFWYVVNQCFQLVNVFLAVMNLICIYMYIYRLVNVLVIFDGVARIAIPKFCEVSNSQ